MTCPSPTCDVCHPRDTRDGYGTYPIPGCVPSSQPAPSPAASDAGPETGPGAAGTS